MVKEFIGKLQGIGSLGAISRDTQKFIRDNKAGVEYVLKIANKEKSRLNGLGATNGVVSLEEFLKDPRYNAGISEDEIRAWVHYKRTNGVPMKGWEKYYINGSNNDTIVTAVTDCEILDDKFVHIGYIPAGTQLGVKNNTKSYEGYVFFMDKKNNLRLVARGSVKETPATYHASQKEIDRLVKAGCLFYNKGSYLPLPIFAYGNSYDRELELNDDQEFITKTYGAKVFENHKKIIMDARPKQISFLDPVSTNRPQLSPISVYAHNFIIEGIEGYEDKHIWAEYVESSESNEVTLASAYEWWLNEMRDDKTLFEKNITSYEIIAYYLRGKNIPRKRLGEKVADEIEKNARSEGERLFGIFIEKCVTYRDKQKLDMSWNRKFNAYPNLMHNKIPIAFSCSETFKSGTLNIKPAQREGVAFMEMVNSGCISFDVGVGKTITAIAEVAMALQEGKCKRPLVAVPNSTYNNWIAEFFGTEECHGVLYGTGVKLNEWKNLGTRVKFSEKDVQDNTITLVTFEGLKKIGLSDNVSDDLQNELKHILLQDTGAVKPRQAAKVEAMVESMFGQGNAGTVIDYDTCGFDYIVLDEAHNAKNVFCSVTTQGSQKKFNQQSGSTPSVLAMKFFILANYTQRKFGGNVMMLTATPFTNSPLEIYSMLAHVAYEDLKSAGHANIEEFCETFILEEKEPVVNAAGDIVDADVVKTFRNRIILQQLIYNHILYKTGEEAGVKRPTKINISLTARGGEKLPANKQILAYLRMTDWQRENQLEINDKINRGLNAHSKEDLKDLLRGMSESLNNAFSPFLYTRTNPKDCVDFVENSPKIKYTCECIKSIKALHDKKGEPCSGQVIFSNRGAEYFSYIKDYLIQKVGFKKGLKVDWASRKFDEVEIMSSATCKDTDDKEEYMRAFNEGVIKVIIGTATIREGVNLQKRSTVLYNLYPDWNPTNIQQLEGRIWRQGNKYQFVRIVLPVCQDSMDASVAQKLDEKTQRINDIWYRADRGNVLNLDSLDPLELKLALVTDIEKLTKFQIGLEKEKYRREMLVTEQRLKEIKEFGYSLKTLNDRRERLLNAMRQAISNMETYVDVISLRPTEEQLKKLDAEKRNKIVKTLETYDTIKAFMSKPTFDDDKELLQMSRKLSNAYNSFPDWYAADFSEYVSKIAKAEKSVLEPKGYTRNSDLQKVIEDFQADYENAQKEYTFLDSPAHFDKVYEEIEEKKRSMNIIGKSVKDRIAEFVKTNYVINYMFDDKAVYANNELPNPKDQQDTNDELPEETQAEESYKTLTDYKFANKFMVKAQKPFVREAWSEYERDIARLDEQLSQIPKIGKQDKLGDKAIVYAHYFGGATDYFVTECSGDELFGYAILNGDVKMSEWGYQMLDELVESNRMELDFHWELKTMEHALYEADSEYFRKPADYDEPTSDEMSEDEEMEMLELEAEALKLKLMLLKL